MTALDWTLIVVYLLGMIALSIRFSRGQESVEDYYVGGRKLPWWAVGLSTMATQSGLISFVSIPAFVALRPRGGLTWLQYEISVPIALVFVMVVLIPFFRKLELVSVYEYLEHRHDRSVRLLISGIFLVSRGLATGVSVFTAALVLQVCLGLPMWIIILVVGVVTVIYDTIGGMVGVVYSDAIQMGILMLGLIVYIVYATHMAGGISAAIGALAPARWKAINPATGLDDGAQMPLWAFLVGGFFLYASYYGVDQSQTQRELAAPTTADTKRSLIFNALARFPLTLLYLLGGVALAGALKHSPGLLAAVHHDGKIDSLVPLFILRDLPQGVRAIVIAAALAAAMSTLDSSLNSLSAATVRDFVARDREIPKDKQLLVSKLTTVCWGAAITTFAFFVGGLGKTVLEAINKIGSVFYGPVLAAFVIGVLSRRANAKGVWAGVLCGIAVNLWLWLFSPQTHWMWWNAIGFAVAAAIGLIVSPFFPAPSDYQLAHFTLQGSGMLKHERRWVPTYAALCGYSLLIFAVGLSAYALAS